MSILSNNSVCIERKWENVIGLQKIEFLRGRVRGGRVGGAHSMVSSGHADTMHTSELLLSSKGKNHGKTLILRKCSQNKNNLFVSYFITPFYNFK
jgi:hypothetical protein